MVIALIALLIVNAPKSKARSLKPHDLAVVTTNAVAFSPDSRTVAGATTDKLVKLWDVATGKDLNTLTGHAQRVTAVAFSPDGKSLASGSQDRTIRLWDTVAMRGEGAKPAEALTLQGHTLGVSSVAFSPDGGWLASGSDDGTVKLWQRDSGELLRTLVGYAREMYPVTSVAISPDGHWLADGNEFDTKLWDLRSMQ